jgi:hypothetical protein
MYEQSVKNVSTPKELREEWEMQPDASVDYEYQVDVVASEAFKNLMSRFGVDIGYDKGWHNFFLDRIIDMKTLKERGVIRAYKILKWTKAKAVVAEEG